MKYFYIFLFFLFSINSFSQVGINTTSPTNTLDIDGDLRVRALPLSASTDDIPIVIDSNGRLKKGISNRIGYYRGRLSSDFDSRVNTPLANGTGIYKINTVGQIIDPNNDFNNTTDIFTAPVTGIYEVTMTLTIRGLGTTNTNYVTGLINQTGNWVMRFSMQKEEFDDSGSVGVARTYTGIAQLTQGELYAFGFASSDFLLIANPTGTSGTGIGSYFRIELIDN